MRLQMFDYITSPPQFTLLTMDWKIKNILCALEPDCYVLARNHTPSPKPRITPNYGQVLASILVIPLSPLIIIDRGGDHHIN